MAVCYMMKWSGVGEAQCDAVPAELGIDRLSGPAADRAVSHLAGPIEGRLQIVDVWESDGAFHQFLADRPGLATAMVVAPEPRVRTFTVDGYFTGSGRVT